MLDGIIRLLPQNPQIMLYSATFPLSVEEFMVSYIVVFMQRVVLSTVVVVALAYSTVVD